MTCYQVDVCEAFEVKGFFHVIFRFRAIFVDVFHGTCNIVFVNYILNWIWPFRCIWIFWINWLIWVWFWFIWIDWFDAFAKSNCELLVYFGIKVKVLVGCTCEAIANKFITFTLVSRDLISCTVINCFTGFTIDLITA